MNLISLEAMSTKNIWHNKGKYFLNTCFRCSNWRLPFDIDTDDLDSSIGAKLGQNEVFLNHAIYFISKKLSPSKLNYKVIET